MKTTLSFFATLMIIATFAMIGSAQVTGNFKAAATFTDNGDENGGNVVVSGTMNHGAIQSGKNVVVEVTAEYSYEYTMEETVNGVTTTTQPARCPDSSNNGNNQCRNKTPQSHPAFFQPTIIETPYSYTISKSFNGSDGMIAMTEPLVQGNKINPKGKIVGYKFSRSESLIPSDDLVNLADLPTGATLVEGSVKFDRVSYRTYLIETDGSIIADTIVTGVLFETVP